MLRTRSTISRFWSADLGAGPWRSPARLPQCTPPAHCDVLVVGAGLTGLAAALSLAARQREVVVLEHAFGVGATTRSGGIVLGDTVSGPAPGFSDCEQALRAWILDLNVECELAWTGCLELARNSMLAADPIDWHDHGAIRMAARVPGGVLDPAKLLAGLADVVSRGGTLVVDDVTVESIENGSGDVRVHTTRGTLRAEQVVMAVDATGWNADFDPWHERAVTVALQTTALQSDVLAAMGFQHERAFYTRDSPLLWGRVMRDQSLLVGRELLPFPWSAPHDHLREHMTDAGTRLLSRVRHLHRSLSACGVQRIWAGPIARSSTAPPGVIRDPQHPRLVWAGGYGGHGLAQAFRVGTLAADVLGER